VLEQKSKTLAITEKIRRPGPNGQAQALEQFEAVLDSGDKQIPNQAFVRVMRGCNKFCTYCVVPYVRGPEVSRPPAGIIEQIKRLAAQGVKQVTLLGQTINSYRYTAGEKTYCLADVLEQVDDVAGIEWIKFVTNYPSQKSFDQILQAMADLPKVCGYLHMPVQSGSDRILKAMNRRHAVGSYLEMLDKARAIVPDIALSGDFIVGFPGETDADFEATVELVKQARYKNCFVFKYSLRPGTSAEGRLADDVPPKVKKERNSKLLAVQQQISDELGKTFLNRTLRVLVEGPSKKPHLNVAESGGRPQLTGRTAGEWIVVFNGPPNLAGNFANVKITKTMPLTLFGQLCG
jgi:tRNA-2-methylthio-N6-dimethylallyladenosine synthase